MRDFFCGWYLKCQSKDHTIAVIPAVHQTGKKQTCSIQVITEDNTWMLEFGGNEFSSKGRRMSIGRNRFCEKGIRLAVCRPEISVRMKLDFGPLRPLKYDIMGPFTAVPFMECRHSVFSMYHRVDGRVWINKESYSFQGALGYWEGDRGRSFPKEYFWTQCFWEEGSLMLSMADIPFAGVHFKGIIGIVLWRGGEYRFATYLGARVKQNKNGTVHVIQGNMELEASLLKKACRPLKAPVKGNMERTVHESVACQAFYRFRKNRQTLFAFTSDRASFEYEYLTDSP